MASPARKAPSWASLGPDSLGACCQFLDPEDVRSVRLVCRSWSQAVGGSLECLRPVQPSVARIAARFPALRRLDLSRCRQSARDADLASLAALPALQALLLAGCDHLTDEAVAAIASGARNLRELDLSGLAISDMALATLGGGSPPAYPAVVSPPRPRPPSPALLLGRFFGSPPRLTRRLPGPDPPGALPRLRALSLAGCAGISERGLAALGPLLARLERLNLAGCGVGVDEAALRTLGGHCVSLTELDLTGCFVTDAGLAALQRLAPTLRALVLWNCLHASDEGLAALKPLQSLEELSLRGWQQLTDAGVARLGALRALRRLDLRACEQVRGETMEALAAPARLEALDLRRCHGLTDAALGGIARQRALRSLLLDGCWQLTGPGLRALGPLAALEELSLLGCRGVWMPDGTALPGLGELVSLRSLVLRSCDRLSGDALAFLSPRLSQLETLDVSSCHLLRGEDLAPLASLPALRTLRAEHCLGLEGPEALGAVGRCGGLRALFLCGCRKLHGGALKGLRGSASLELVSLHGCHGVPALDAGLAAMLAPGSHPRVHTLSLQGCDSVTDAGVACLRHLGALRALHLSDCAHVTGTGFAEWRGAAPTPAGLATLHLQNCPAISDEGCRAIATLGPLRELRLKACQAVTERGLQALARGLRDLRSLSMQNMSLTDGGVAPLAELQALVSLELQFCWKITDAGVTALTRLARLRRLDLLYSWQVTDAVLQRLAAMPCLRRLNLTGCHRISETGKASVAHLLPRDQKELL